MRHNNTWHTVRVPVSLQNTHLRHGSPQPKDVSMLAKLTNVYNYIQACFCCQLMVAAQLINVVCAA